jgi:hypothetical protein
MSSLFVENDTTITNPLLYKHIYVNNLKKINIILQDIELNHTLHIERMNINDTEVWVNTTRGNYILNKLEPTLHLVNFYKKWIPIGRENAVPLLDKSIDKKIVENSLYQNCNFGYHFLNLPKINTIQTYEENKRYYISERLIVSAPNFFKGNLGCLFVYSQNQNGQYTVLEDFITIPYQNEFGDYQGNFGTYFEILDLNQSHFLIVGANNRKRPNFKGSIFIFSYRMRQDGTFYFFNETSFQKEIIIPRNLNITKIVCSEKAIHILIGNEIVSYYLDIILNTLVVSDPYFYTYPSPILDIICYKNNLFIISQNDIYSLTVPQTKSNLYNNIKAIDRLTIENQSPKKIYKDSSGLIVSSENKFYLFDSNLNLENDFGILSSEIIDFDLQNRNKIYLLAKNKSNNQYEILFYQNFGSSESMSSVNIDGLSEYSKLRIDNSGNVFLGYPLEQDGKIKVFQIGSVGMSITSNLIYEISNFKERHLPSYFSSFINNTSDLIYYFDSNLKIFTVLERDRNNTFILRKSILPLENVQKYLNYNDKILDIQFHPIQNLLIIGITKYNELSGYVIAIDTDFSLIGIWNGSSKFGTSISIHDYGYYALISDPSYPYQIIQNKINETGAIYILSLEDLTLSTNLLRSSNPIGDLVKFSDIPTEFISIGKKNNKKSVTWFSNIFASDYRTVVLDENITEADYFLEGQLILTNNELVNGKQQYYRNQKVNGCFEIMTKQLIQIPEITTSSTLKMLKLGRYYVFYLDKVLGKIYLMDVRNMKLIIQWSDDFQINPSISKDGSVITYANIGTSTLTLICCS